MTKLHLKKYRRVKITLILIIAIVFASSVLLNVYSNNKDFLPPSMSETQMNAISNPKEGLMIYCSDCTPKGVYIYNGNKFRILQFFENPAEYLNIADVSVPRGTTTFVISPVLVSRAATVYSLINPPKGVFISGTTVSVPANMDIGEYNITVKAIGNGDYNGETQTTFRLMIIKLYDAFVINFKDENFKNKVKSYLNITANEVTYGDVKNVTKLDVSTEIDASSYITNMEEIRYFDSLKILYCEKNQLTSLDLSQNTVLETLYCYNNQLTSLDLSRNTVLEVLDCSGNQLTSLDISRNTDLEGLNCSSNQLTSLDLSRNTDLKILYCEKNQLTSLDLSQNTDLEELNCYNNQLTSLDISRNTVLEELNCTANQLTSLDISQNTDLEGLNCSRNQLTSLDISRNTVLEKLYCTANQLTSLDISQNTDLEELYCSYNRLTSLDLSRNTVLEKLSCQENRLTSLDLRQNTKLMNLVCRSNQLTSLDIRGMRRVLQLRISNTTLQTLKVHQNIKDYESIIDFKTARGSNVTISTYSAPAGSTTYKLICNDYDPRGGYYGGACND